MTTKKELPVIQPLLARARAVRVSHAARSAGRTAARSATRLAEVAIRRVSTGSIGRRLTVAFLVVGALLVLVAAAGFTGSAAQAAARHHPGRPTAVPGGGAGLPLLALSPPAAQP